MFNEQVNFCAKVSYERNGVKIYDTWDIYGLCENDDHALESAKSDAEIFYNSNEDIENVVVIGVFKVSK